MKPFQRGQIWLVNFDPSFGYEYRKVRPALIVENTSCIESSNLLTCCPISSQTDKPFILDYEVTRNDQNRLMKDSLVKIMQISSFDKRRFIKFVGVIDAGEMEEIDQNLKMYLSL